MSHRLSSPMYLASNPPMTESIDIPEQSREAWNRIADRGDEYYVAASKQEIEWARKGDIRIKLTPTKNVPPEWIGTVKGCDVLLLACGGGQQSPLFAAAGASTTVFDISEKQLARDRQIADQYDLNIEIVRGDMADLSAFKPNSFDLIINPCSVCYCDDVHIIWSETERIMKPGAKLMSGFIKPVNYLFDALAMEEEELVVQNRIPYRDTDLPAEHQQLILGPERPLEFGHSLSQLIGGQLRAGLQLVGFYEDRWGDDDLLSQYIDVFAATLSIKPEA
ncbi:MAG: class I SAM-dependent methyltransferase [Planctomycetota bacterium]